MFVRAKVRVRERILTLARVCIVLSCPCPGPVEVVWGAAFAVAARGIVPTIAHELALLVVDAPIWVL